MLEQITFRTQDVEIFIEHVTGDWVVEVYSNETYKLIEKAIAPTISKAIELVNKSYLGGVLNE
ncbi:hypothetical protein Q8A72_13995 [Aeribacillus pallidus]|uniref:hypothetical protein n=1 Tax=Aeribacillus sp. FSL K6-1305 TaxID=2954569 RepID=UPI002870D9EB|nr:hypothetical protein [Aeribacillus pallidus]